MQVGGVAIGAAHTLDLPVAAIEDDALTQALPDSDPAFPPGDHGLAVVALSAEVGRLVDSRQRPEPQHLAAVVEHHRPVLALAALRGEEHPAARGARLARRDLHGRWLQVRARPEALDLAVTLHELVRRGGGEAATRRRVGDREGEVTLASPADPQPGVDLHLLPRLERLVRHEARAAAVGVLAHATGVAATVRALDPDS